MSKLPEWAKEEGRRIIADGMWLTDWLKPKEQPKPSPDSAKSGSVPG